jgi:hypothetical protein
LGRVVVAWNGDALGAPPLSGWQGDSSPGKKARKKKPNHECHQKKCQKADSGFCCRLLLPLELSRPIAAEFDKLPDVPAKHK